MTDAHRDERLRRARTLEQRGDVDAASEAYLQAGSLGEAARVLADAGRFTDAGNVLLRALGRPIEQLRGLRGRDRRIAEKAAECFAQGGDPARADAIRRALEAPSAPNTSREAGWRQSGHTDEAREKMIQDLLAAGRMGAAARVAWEAGRLAEASRWFLELGYHYEAGMCLADMNDLDNALEHLLLVASDHKYYRRAAARVVEIAKVLDRFDFEVDRFVSPFLWSPPEKKKEVEAYLTAARLYGRQGFDASAREVLERVLEFDPSNEQARTLLERIAQRRSLRSSVPPRPSAPPRPTPTRRDSLPDLPPLEGYVRPGSSQPPRRPPSSQPSTRSVSSPPPARPAPSPPPARPAPSQPPAAPVPSPPPAAPADHSAPTQPSSRPAPPPVEEVAPGAIVAGRYRIVSQLGAGGMAVVWRALDAELNEEIALKLLHPGPAAEAWLPRFRQELSLARVLTHKNIVRVFDIGSHGTSRFITMELLEGRAVDEMFDQPIGLLEGIHWMIQVCAGLRVAHDQGIIHRDLKPSNIFVTRSGVVKLMDFGIAKAPGSDGGGPRGITVAGAIVGTPEYMSPEQIDDAASVTAASDIYSLGVVLYEMYTLTCPFEDESMMAVLRAHHESAPPPPRDRNPAIPDSMQEVILRCLAKDPARRYPNATELARALRGVARDLR